MNAAAVKPPRQNTNDGGFWLMVVSVPVILCLCVLLLEGITTKGGDWTGFVSTKFMGQEWVDERVAHHNARVDEAGFINEALLGWPSPTCAKPEKWKVMSEKERTRWHAYWAKASADNMREGKQKNYSNEVTMWSRMETTENCYVSERVTVPGKQ